MGHPFGNVLSVGATTVWEFAICWASHSAGVVSQWAGDGTHLFKSMEC